MMPEACIASRRVAPGATSRLTASSAPGSAYTTSTLSGTMDLIGAARKGVHHCIGNAVEQRLQQPREDAAREFVFEREVDLAGAGRERREAPGGREAPERSLDQAHVDRTGRVVVVLRSARLA